MLCSLKLRRNTAQCFHLNGPTSEIHPQTQKLEPLIHSNKYYIHGLASTYIGFRPQTLKLKPHNANLVWSFRGAAWWGSFLFWCFQVHLWEEEVFLNAAVIRRVKCALGQVRTVMFSAFPRYFDKIDLRLTIMNWQRFLSSLIDLLYENIYIGLDCLQFQSLHLILIDNVYETSCFNSIRLFENDMFFLRSFFLSWNRNTNWSTFDSLKTISSRYNIR